MVYRNLLVVISAVFALSSAAPIEKRIAQTIADSTSAWEKACVRRRLHFTSYNWPTDSSTF
jgi:hypothetical protein